MLQLRGGRSEEDEPQRIRRRVSRAVEVGRTGSGGCGILLRLQFRTVAMIAVQPPELVSKEGLDCAAGTAKTMVGSRCLTGGTAISKLNLTANCDRFSLKPAQFLALKNFYY